LFVAALLVELVYAMGERWWSYFGLGRLLGVRN